MSATSVFAGIPGHGRVSGYLVRTQHTEKVSDNYRLMGYNNGFCGI